MVRCVCLLVACVVLCCGLVGLVGCGGKDCCRCKGDGNDCCPTKDDCERRRRRRPHRPHRPHDTAPVAPTAPRD